ncbi:MAG: hypothetical protein KC550_01055 [Nanoarchaeota archaeon]|nr:hypothetical protein [Nanoarchaeota archaeon]
MINNIKKIIVVFVCLLLVSGCSISESSFAKYLEKEYNLNINQEGFDNITYSFANTISSNFNEINVEALTTYEEKRDAIIKINKLIEKLNSELDLELDKIKLDDITLKNIDSMIHEGGKLLPVLKSYNNVVKSANLVISNNIQESINDFYKNVGILGFEIIMVEAQLGYKITYKIVGEFAWKSGIITKLGPIIGGKNLSFVLGSMYASIQVTALHFYEKWVNS